MLHHEVEHASVERILRVGVGHGNALGGRCHGADVERKAHGMVLGVGPGEGRSGTLFFWGGFP